MTWLKLNLLKKNLFNFLCSKLFLGLIIAFTCITFVCQKTQLVISQSPSLHHKVFLIIKGMPAHKGNLVSFKGHKTKYFGDVIFTKRIMGVAGEKLTLQNGAIWVEGRVFSLLPVIEKGLPLNGSSLNDPPFNGVPLGGSPRGGPLTPLKARIIPQGYVFVSGDHPRSFDSRYEEFGLVNVESFIGRTFPVW